MTNLIPLVKVKDGPLSSLEGELTNIHAWTRASDRVTGVDILVVIKLKFWKFIHKIDGHKKCLPQVAGVAGSLRAPPMITSTQLSTLSRLVDPVDTL